MLPVAHQFARLVTAELSAIGRADQFVAILGAGVAAVEGLEDARLLAPLVKRWNVHAGAHPPLARVAFYNRGMDSEVSLGHRGAGKVYP
ncbi:MAG: hypothetical protein EXR69_01355 [Myxococcales bacterium]|nr:hypothetical protein [Myxococcales bacterium]